MCCIVFVYMFSGMRDSEVQSLKRGCVEPFWGHLTLTGKEFKTFRGTQARWVVIEPVARAARLAEALSWHDDRIVVSARPGSDHVIDAGLEIDSLIKPRRLPQTSVCSRTSPTVLPFGHTAFAGRLPLRPGNTPGCRSL